MEITVLDVPTLDERYQLIDNTLNQALRFYMPRVEYYDAQYMILFLLRWKVRLYRVYEDMKGRAA